MTFWSRLRTKLNSESGASIMFAFAILVVATMVSVTIVSAALTTAKHIRGNQNSQQNMLALQSAAKLLGENLNGARCITEKNGTGNEVGVTQMKGSGGDVIIEDRLKAAVKYVEEQALNEQTTDYKSDSFKITVSDEDCPDVNVSFILKSGKYSEDDKGNKYNLIFKFTIAPKEGIKNSYDAVYLTINGNGDPGKLKNSTPNEITWFGLTYSADGGGAFDEAAE